MIEIKHRPEIVSFAHVDNNTKDLYTYYFELKDGAVTLHSIDKWAKVGKSGVTYRHSEVYHHEYKRRVINPDTGEHEIPAIPECVLESAKNLITGYIISRMQSEIITQIK